MIAPRPFLLNDRTALVEVPAGVSTLTWLRERQGLKGTKEGCGEGECGACAVLLGEVSPVHGGVTYRAIASCLLPVGELPGRHLVTIEGLTPAEGLSPIQQALVDAGAPQCGFCFPGIVVSLAGFFLNSRGLANEDAVTALDGNICRCTGYTAIMTAIGTLRDTFAPRLDPDRGRIEQLVAWGVLPEFFATVADRLRGFDGEPEPVEFATGSAPVLIAGGTDLCVQQPEALADLPLVFLSRRSELARIRREDTHLSIGGGVTVETLHDDPEFARLVPRAAAIVELFGSTLIRSRATVAGNLVNASPIGDLTVLLLALDAEVVLARGEDTRPVALADFYRGYKDLASEPGDVLTEVRVPLSVGEDTVCFEKVSSRRYLDIASVNSAARFRLKDGHVEKAALSFGGVAPVPFLARETSRQLEGRTLAADTVHAAARTLDGEIAPIDDVRGSAAYKRELARRLLFAHVLQAAPGCVTLEELL